MKNTPNLLWMLVHLPDQSHRISTVLESHHKKHTEQVGIFTFGEAGDLDFLQFPVGFENLTFKAQMCHL